MRKLPPLKLQSPYPNRPKIYIQLTHTQNTPLTIRNNLSQDLSVAILHGYPAWQQRNLKYVRSSVKNSIRQLNTTTTHALYNTLQHTHFATTTHNPQEADFILSGSFIGGELTVHASEGAVYNRRTYYLHWTLTHAKTQALLHTGRAKLPPVTHPSVSPEHQVLLALHNIPLHTTPPPKRWTPSRDLSIPTTPNTHTWVVSIGVETYRNDLPKALYASNDATAFASLAHSLWNIPQSNIKTLTNQDATHAAVTSTLQEWLPKNVQPGDRVILFISAHGTFHPQTRTTSFALYDTNLSYPTTTTTSLQTLYDNLNALPSSSNLVLLDTCFSGTGPRSSTPYGLRPLLPKDLPPTSQHTVTLSASQANQTAQTAPNAPHGLFTYHLLSALYGKADRDGDRSISLQEAYLYTLQHVQHDATLLQRPQTPTLQLPPQTHPQHIPLSPPL